MRLLRLLPALLALGLGGQAVAPPGLHPVALLSPGAGPGPGSALVLGAWEGGRWRDTASIRTRFPAQATWRVQALGSAATTVRGTRRLDWGGVPCEATGFLELPNVAPTRAYRLATSPALNTRPRPVEALPTTSATYRNIVRDELLRLGVKNPVVNLTAVIRADLDGNGTREVILAASHFREKGAAPHIPPPRAGAGDYSLLLLRWAHSGQARTTVLGASVFTRDERSPDDWQMPTLSDLAGVADLNGDGRMELVVAGTYYEGAGASVLEWMPAGGLRERLSAGCGV